MIKIINIIKNNSKFFNPNIESHTVVKKSLIWTSIAVVIHLLRPVALTYLGVKQEPRVAVIYPELKIFDFICCHKSNLIYPSSVADEIFGAPGLLVGVGAVPGTLE